jgi:predicted transcriptional regulator
MLNIVLNDSQLLQLANQIAEKIIGKTPNTNNELITTQDVLQLCRISKPTLISWRQLGLLPYKKVGRIIYYQKNDVYKLIKP